MNTPNTPQTWTRIANEDERVEVPADSVVRYGESAERSFTERTVSGWVTASNAFFGTDPAPNVAKSLWLRDGAAQPPAPPAPEPAPAPVVTLPAITDPDFDKKMRLIEQAQRERAIAANEELAAASRFVGQKYAELQAMLEARAGL